MSHKRSRSKTPRLLTRRELAEALGVAPRTIAKWQDEGLPVAERGRGGRASRYDVNQCRRWKEQHDRAGANGLTEALAAKHRAQAQLAEQTYQLRLGELLPCEEVRRVWDAEITAVRSRLLSWPQTITDRLVRAYRKDGAAGLEAALDTAIFDVLTELADPNRDPQPPRRDGSSSKEERK